MKKTAAVFLLLVSICFGGEYASTRSVPANSWVEIDVGGPCVLSSDQVDVRIYARIGVPTEDGFPLDGYVGVLWSGTHEEIIVTEAKNGPVVPVITEHIILVRDSPDPKPIPDPDPPPVDPLPETQYNIGPAVGRAFRSVPEPSRGRVMEAFRTAARDAATVAKPIATINAELESTISDINNDAPVAEPYNRVYLPLFQDLIDAGTLVGLSDYAQAWSEIVEWWNK